MTLPFMDACHLLLGRLLHYDRNVLYYGYKHTCTFIANEKRLVLAPSQPSKPSPSKRKASVVVSIFECKNELERSMKFWRIWSNGIHFFYLKLILTSTISSAFFIIIIDLFWFLCYQLNGSRSRRSYDVLDSKLHNWLEVPFY